MSVSASFDFEGLLPASCEKVMLSDLRILLWCSGVEHRRRDPPPMLIVHMPARVAHHVAAGRKDYLPAQLNVSTVVTK